MKAQTTNYVDKHFIDKLTSLDNLLSELLSTHKNTFDAINAILELQQQNIFQTFNIGYPQDGTTKSVGIGETVINFLTGRISLPSGEEVNLTHSLETYNQLIARSLYFYADKDVIIQLDDQDKIPIQKEATVSYTHQRFTKVDIITSETTSIYILASTHPEATLNLNLPACDAYNAAVIPAGDTSVTVAHGLGVTPTTIQITPKTEEGIDCYYSDENSSTFKINLLWSQLVDCYFTWFVK